MFTTIAGTVTESNEILVDRDKIAIIFKQSQMTQKPADTLQHSPARCC